MIYPFYCNNELCPDEGKDVNIEMKMSEYTSEIYCPTCGDLMKRPVKSMVCGYVNDRDFYGKVSN